MAGGDALVVAVQGAVETAVDRELERADELGLGSPLTANAYLGAFPIASALERTESEAAMGREWVNTVRCASVGNSCASRLVVVPASSITEAKGCSGR